MFERSHMHTVMHSHSQSLGKVCSKAQMNMYKYARLCAGCLMFWCCRWIQIDWILKEDHLVCNHLSLVFFIRATHQLSVSPASTTWWHQMQHSMLSPAESLICPLIEDTCKGGSAAGEIFLIEISFSVMQILSSNIVEFVGSKCGSDSWRGLFGISRGKRIL